MDDALAELDRMRAVKEQEIPGLRQYLSIEAWADREMPQPDRLLGDLLTTTSRMFLVGRTGLGKTLFAVALGCGIASGSGFLHWKSSRLARVLILDGEMPGELIRERSIDALRRAGVVPAPGNLIIYARDTEDDFMKRFPALGRMPPLNTEQGMNWMLELMTSIGGVDVVIFDNVMSLIAGDQKDEIPWSDTLPLVQKLTARRIGQIWLDHTGHNTDRQYGSSTKAWRFDAVGIMAPLSDDERRQDEVAFTLSFEHPGKARRRTPDNWQDFETVRISLCEDRWSSEPVDGHRKLKKLPPSRSVFHEAMLDAVAAGRTIGPGKVSRSAWEAECIRRNLMQSREASTEPESKRTQGFRRAIYDLQGAKWIGSDGDTFTDMTRHYGRN